MVVMPGMGMNESITPILVIEAKIPPIFVNPSDLGGAESAGKVFTMGVRIKTENVCIKINKSEQHLIKFLQGFVSPIRELEHIEIQPDQWFTKILPTTTPVWLVIVPIILVISLVLVVLYLLQRHRRLANSFSRFANSHYDTKTGATRIGDALDEDDHHEPPRFDDDEPLVIA